MYDHLIAPFTQKLDAEEYMNNMRGPCERVKRQELRSSKSLGGQCTGACLQCHYSAIAKLVERLIGMFFFHNVRRSVNQDRLIPKLKASMELAGVKIIFVNLGVASVQLRIKINMMDKTLSHLAQ